VRAVRKEVVRVRESKKLRTLTYICLMVEGVAREVDEALFPRPLGEDAATHAIGFHSGGLFDQDISAYEHISARADFI